MTGRRVISVVDGAMWVSGMSCCGWESGAVWTVTSNLFASLRMFFICFFMAFSLRFFCSGEGEREELEEREDEEEEFEEELEEDLWSRLLLRFSDLDGGERLLDFLPVDCWR